jgi:hypothetical protein
MPTRGNARPGGSGAGVTAIVSAGERRVSSTGHRPRHAPSAFRRVLDLLAEAARRMGYSSDNGSRKSARPPSVTAPERMQELFAKLDARIMRQRLEQQGRAGGGR